MSEQKEFIAALEKVNGHAIAFCLAGAAEVKFREIYEGCEFVEMDMEEVMNSISYGQMWGFN